MSSRQGVLTDEDPLVVSALWRSIRVFRPLALGYAVGLAWARQGEMVAPRAAGAVLAVLGCWTVVQFVRTRRDLLTHSVELVLACAAIVATRFVDAPAAAQEGTTTLPGVWQSVSVVALGVILGWRGGVAAGAFVALCQVATVGEVTLAPLSDGLLVMLLGGCVGYCADLAREEQRGLRRAMEEQAEDLERERLARTVHDGVLQALAFIHRRGLDLGDEGARLGAMAGEQEARLRALVSGVPLDELEATVGGPVDLCAAMKQATAGTASIVGPADPVMLGRRCASEVVAAVAAALDNVRRHAGEGAHAWVLIDDAGDNVVVTVRDDGVGISQDRITEAFARGRLGVSSSIRGRLEDLGGSARYLFGPGGGTTVEMWVPKTGE